MTVAGWSEIALYFVVLTALTPVLGAYMARVYQGEVGVAPVERLIGRLTGGRSQSWRGYARLVLAFSAVSFGLLYLILRTSCCRCRSSSASS